jgi:hypothetical protein
MKMPICLALALLATGPAHAQIFGPNATGGALLGGLAGGIIGHNDHNQTGRGIAIGAASGLILGSIADQANYQSYQGTQAPGYYDSGYADTGYGYGRPNYAASGALLGGLAGGIIGYKNHYQTGRGILIGSLSGLILGSIADQAAREREVAAVRTVVVTAPVQPAPAPLTQEPPPQVAPAAPVSPMGSANSLFGRN